ncbi:MAG TPA: type II toxin-antitoxin system VapC family toxin [Gemmatimonadaceae bacterium]
MIAYLDSSVILRVVLGQPGKLAEWKSVLLGVTSELAEVECLRTMDRLRLLDELTAEEAASGREAIYRIMEALEVVELSSAVMRRASQPMPAPLGTLDAIHLATADLWREGRGKDPIVATHDKALALAARASGFRVMGV